MKQPRKFPELVSGYCFLLFLRPDSLFRGQPSKTPPAREPQGGHALDDLLNEANTAGVAPKKKVSAAREEGKSWPGCGFAASVRALFGKIGKHLVNLLDLSKFAISTRFSS